MKKQLTQSVKKENLERKIARLIRNNKYLKRYKNVVKDYDMSPDEIRLKLNQIVNLDDKNKTN